MSSAEHRLDQVMKALSGRERAIVFLQAYKEGTTTDPTCSGWFSDNERRAYNRLIDIIRFCNGELADIILMVKEQVTQQELRYSWLQSARIAADDLWLVGQFLDECVKEPIAEGELAKRRKKKAPAAGFDVFADEDADEVQVLRENRRLIDILIGRGCRLKLPLDLAGDLPAEPTGVVDTARVVATIVRDGLASYWTQLQAVVTVLDELAEEFNGADPLKPYLREFLDDALRRIVAVKEELAEYIGEWELPDDHDESLDAVRRLVERVLA